VQATLGTVNETLSDVVYNEDRLREGLTRLQQYVNTMVVQYGNATNSLSVKLEVKEHISTALDATSVVQRNLDLIVDSIRKAQKGILQPLTVTPGLLFNAITRSSPAFPQDAVLPIPLSKDSIHLLYQICDVHVFMRRRMLVYVLAIPLVSKGHFDVLNVIPLPVVIGDKNLVYVNVEKGMLYVDRARQFYFMMDESEWKLCKTIGRNFMCISRDIRFCQVTC
jgi:hypothetical protein